MSLESKPVILYSRSAVVTDWTCPRKRWWNYEYAGRGITPAQTSLELYLGTVVHDGLAAIAHGLEIDEIANAATTQLRGSLLDGVSGDTDAEYFAEEQCALVEGMLRGFRRQIWPLYREIYPEIVLIEKECVYEHDGLTFMAKPDLVVRDSGGCLWYIEYKTTSTNKEQWISSWASAVQLHSSIKAVEAHLGEEVTGVVVCGLYKGYVSYDKQSSPFCYAYHKPAEPPFIKAVWSYDYRAGLKRYPVWLRDGGVKRWVAEMPEVVLSQQFPQTPPIMVDKHLVDAFFRQQSYREHNIRTSREQLNNPDVDEITKAHLLDAVFPQHFENCSPGWGKGCQYRKLCFGTFSDPLSAGFSQRQSHHQLEQDALESAGS